jgi:acyl-CoA thioesterase-1
MDRALSRRTLLLRGAACAALAAAGGCTARREPPLARGSTVLAFGDSLTFGTGAEPEAAYPVRLAATTGWQVTNAGRPGATTADGIATLGPALAQARPAAVLLGLGGNDFLRGLPADQTHANLVAMVRECRSAGARVLLIAVPRPSLLAAAARALSDHPVFEAVAEATEVPVLAGAWATVLSDASLRSDPIHANAQGYARFAELATGRLKALGWVG